MRNVLSLFGLNRGAARLHALLQKIETVQTELAKAEQECFEQWMQKNAEIEELTAQREFVYQAKTRANRIANNLKLLVA